MPSRAALASVAPSRANALLRDTLARTLEANAAKVHKGSIAGILALPSPVVMAFLEKGPAAHNGVSEIAARAWW